MRNSIDAIPAEDRFSIADALYKFARGQDLGERDTLTAAFAENAVLDFTHPALKLGVEIDAFIGRESIVEIIWTATRPIVTSHTITNILPLAYEGRSARISALIEAFHQRREAPFQVLLLKNHLDVELDRGEQGWQIGRMVFRNLWKEGEGSVLFPEA